MKPVSPSAQLTVTDLEPTFVAGMEAGDLGSHPRAVVRQMDATEIDAPEGYYDLAVFALSLHHLTPELAVQVFAAGTRAAKKLLIVDLPRPPAPLHVLLLAVVLPLVKVSPLQHDGFISSLRAYSPAALRALGQHADPSITVEGWVRRWRWPAGPGTVADGVDRTFVTRRVVTLLRWCSTPWQSA